MKYNMIIACMVLSFISCSTEQIFTDKDQQVDFKQYQTFAWYARPVNEPAQAGFDNQILESNIKNYTSAELKLRELKVDIDSPDLIMDYQLMVKQKMQREQVPIYNNHPYNYGFYNPYRPYAPNYYYAPQILGYQTEEIPYTEGTLIVTATDRKSNRIVWRGWSVGTVVDEQTYENDLQRDIQKIMKNFPIAVQHASK